LFSDQELENLIKIPTALASFIMVYDIFSKRFANQFADIN